MTGISVARSCRFHKIVQGNHDTKYNQSSKTRCDTLLFISRRSSQKLTVNSGRAYSLLLLLAVEQEHPCMHGMHVSAVSQAWYLHVTQETNSRRARDSTRIPSEVSPSVREVRKACNWRVCVQPLLYGIVILICARNGALFVKHCAGLLTPPWAAGLADGQPKLLHTQKKASECECCHIGSVCLEVGSHLCA